MAIITPWPLFIWLLLLWPLFYRSYYSCGYYAVAIITVAIIRVAIMAWKVLTILTLLVCSSLAGYFGYRYLMKIKYLISSFQTALQSETYTRPTPKSLTHAFPHFLSKGIKLITLEVGFSQGKYNN